MAGRFRPLTQLVAALGVADPTVAISAGEVEVDGLVNRNPAARIAATASVRLRRGQTLRGAVKLNAALDGFAIDVSERIALDVGAAAGGFTTALLDRGAARVYACDAGHGQLRGHLCQDSRVVNLEGTNVADLNTHLVPDPLEIVTVDVSYLSLGSAVAQLGDLRLAPGCALVGLVKPMFELGLAVAPTDLGRVAAATSRAGRAISGAGWTVIGSMPSPTTGARGSVEALLHARF
ncbi:MAG: SAM-dependent methyltransferase [Candidatus Dormibacteria bacterium]